MATIVDNVFFIFLGTSGIIILIIAFVKLYQKICRDNGYTQTKDYKEQNKDNYITNEYNEQSKQKIDYSEYLPYCKKYLLTKNEWFFYKVLKQIAEELGYTVLAKVRVADLVEVTARDYALKGTYLNKVASKHIDFVLARPENLKVELLIELDDNTHDSIEKRERDDFINKLYQQTGYKFIRVRGTGNLKEIIKEQLKEQETAPTVDGT